LKAAIRRHVAAEADRAWHVVAGAFLVTMVGFGAIYSYAAFAEQIAADFGASRAAVTLVYALSGGACFTVGVLTGPLADRIGARVLACFGMVLVGLGFLVAASARSLIEVYAGYGLLVGVGAGCAYVPAMATVQRWFRVHRGLASGLAVTGIGVGTALVPPAADLLASLGDWRAGFAACAGLSLLFGLPGAMLLQTHPGEEPPSRAIPAPPHVVATPRFALLYAGTLLVSVPASVPHALLVGTARDIGLGAHDAVALLGLIGLGTIAGRFLLAALADVLGRRSVFLACCAGMSAAILVWAVAETAPALQGFALGFGALQGGFVALLPAFVADRFGQAGLGGVLGVLYTSRGMALLAGPPAAALGIAAIGVAVPLLVVALLGALGAWMLAMLR
jgi:MFS transporter, OFA family, oxalate/formate antiporter